MQGRGVWGCEMWARGCGNVVCRVVEGGALVCGAVVQHVTSLRTPHACKTPATINPQCLSCPARGLLGANIHPHILLKWRLSFFQFCWQHYQQQLPPIESVASDIASVSPDPSAGALHPNVGNSLQPFIESIASDIGSVLPDRFVGAPHSTVVIILHPFIELHCFRCQKRFWSRCWVRTPGVRCVPYPGTIIR